MDPDIPFSWRLDRAQAGTGALGDLGSHTIAFAYFLVGEIAEVCGLSATRITERAMPAGGSATISRCRRSAARSCGSTT